MSKQLMTFAFLTAIFPMAVSLTNAQSTQKKTEQKKAEQKSSVQKKVNDDDDETQIQKSALLGELTALESDAVNLNPPISRALVKTEIADVAWNLDKQWAKQLLRDAIQLALPDKETRRKYQKVKKGDNPVEPTKGYLPWMFVRPKVMAVARRDPAFADELAKIAKEEMGAYDEVLAYSSAAHAAITADEKKQAVEYARKIFDADPSTINAGGAIAMIASSDRGEADKLILEYIQKLRSFPINPNNAWRIFHGLSSAVYPYFSRFRIYQGRKFPVAGKEAMRAYYGFLIETLLDLESREPGAAMKLSSLISPQTWPFVSQQAPEFVDSYLKLEAASGIAKEYGSHQTSSLEERDKAWYETVVNNARTTNSQNEIVQAIHRAIGREDYETCRELIEKLSQRDLRTKYSEDVNRYEAVSLLGKEDFDGAARLAGKLDSVGSLEQVYPQLIKFCVDKNDPDCINSLASELTSKLEKKAESSKAASILSRVAATVAAKDEAIAMNLLRQAISSANASDVKRTSENAHIVEFDNKAFELLGLSHEGRMFQMAKSLDDRLCRYLALTAIYRGKANALLKKTTKTREGN